MSVAFKPGDMYIVDKSSTEAKIVKFLMQSPTVWHWLLGKLIYVLTKKKIKMLIDDVRVYHPGIIVSDTHVIEQQKVVELNTIERAFLNKPHIVYRRLNVSDEERFALVALALEELGEGYDIILIIGKTLTWLTGIKLFTIIFNLPDKEICVTRVAKWFYKTYGDTFGRSSWHFVTTDDIDNWCAVRPEVYKEIENTLQ